MPKPARQISVSKAVKMLIEEGYRGARNSELSELEQNFSAAFFLAKELRAHRNTLDFVLSDYVARSKRSNFLTHTLELPCPTAMLKFAKLGASRPAVEALAKEFARQGMIGPFRAAVGVLGREPEEAEVIMLVDDYVKGAIESIDTEVCLLRLARGVSHNLDERMGQKISARRQRLALQCD